MDGAVLDRQSRRSPYQHQASREVRRYCLAADSFWRGAPLLLVGFALYLGLLGRAHSISAAFTLLLFLLPFAIAHSWGRMGIALFVALAAFGYGVLTYCSPTTPLHGTAWIKVQSVRPSRSLFSSGWIVSGKIRSFKEVRDLPVTLFLSPSCQLPSFDTDYLISGTLCEGGRGYQFKWDKEVAWEPVMRSRSVAGARLRMRKWIEKRIQSRIGDRPAADLAGGLLLGDVAESATRLDFGRLGLQHLMAISGFHFSLLAFALTLLFTKLLPRSLASLFVLLLLTGYLFLTGAGAASQRAWVMAALALLAGHIGRQGNSLNSLGAALLFVLLLNPAAFDQIGFQLSFAATASILLFYTPIRRGLERLLPRRKLREALKLSLFDQHLVVAAAALRSALSLLIAVHLAILPLTLFYFHRFPLLSLIYNLVVPLLVGGILLSLLSAFLFPPLFFLVQQLCKILLNFVHYVPASLDFTLRIDSLPTALIVSWFVALLMCGVWVRGGKGLAPG